MFARVITAQAGTQGFDSFIRMAREQLPGARQQPRHPVQQRGSGRFPAEEERRVLLPNAASPR